MVKASGLHRQKRRRDVQHYRAKSGAVLSTSQTVIEDNAPLNVRWAELPSSIKDHYAGRRAMTADSRYS